MKSYLSGSIKTQDVSHEVLKAASKSTTQTHSKTLSAETSTAVLGWSQCCSGEIYLQLLEGGLHQNIIQTESCSGMITNPNASANSNSNQKSKECK